MTLIAPLHRLYYVVGHEPNRRCTHVNEGLSPLSVVITTSIGLWKLHRVGVGFSGGWKLLRFYGHFYSGVQLLRACRSHRLICFN